MPIFAVTVVSTRLTSHAVPHHGGFLLLLHKTAHGHLHSVIATAHSFLPSLSGGEDICVKAVLPPSAQFADLFNQGHHEQRINFARSEIISHRGEVPELERQGRQAGGRQSALDQPKSRGSEIHPSLLR